MTPHSTTPPSKRRLRGLSSWLVLAPAALLAYACSGSGETGSGSAGGSGASGAGAASGSGAANGDGTGDGSGAGDGGTGTGSGTDTSGGDPTQVNGGVGSYTGTGYATGGPRFAGSGTSFTGAPLTGGQGPETADSCLEPPNLAQTQSVVTGSGQECFYGSGDTTPAATVEYVIEAVGDKEYVHIRITFDPGFVDNSYGEGSIGWSPKRGHRYSDLVGSDHAEIKLLDGNGDVAMHFKVDYITEDPTAPCGYGSLGVTGGDGSMFVGDPNDVLAVTTSLDRNLNACGYCNTVDSPATDANFTANPDTPEWDYRMVYDVWIDADAFGDAGFGGSLIESVHASPSKQANDTVVVEPAPCPPNWDEPYCPPHLVEENGSCGGTPPPDDGTPPTGGDGGTPPPTGGDGGTPPPTNPDYPPSVDGQCPDGYVPDIQTEGQYCVPAG